LLYLGGSTQTLSSLSENSIFKNACTTRETTEVINHINEHEATMPLVPLLNLPENLPV
jgi:hypothetical protein